MKIKPLFDIVIEETDELQKPYLHFTLSFSEWGDNRNRN